MSHLIFTFFFLTFGLPVSSESNIFHMPAYAESILSLIRHFYISISILDMIDALCPVSVQLYEYRQAVGMKQTIKKKIT